MSRSVTRDAYRKAYSNPLMVIPAVLAGIPFILAVAPFYLAARAIHAVQQKLTPEKPEAPKQNSFNNTSSEVPQITDEDVPQSADDDIPFS